jgi:uncharacterized protein YkwD
MFRRTKMLTAMTAASVAILALTASPIAEATTASAVVKTTGKPVRLTAFENRLLHLMNHDRAVRGLHPLTIAPCAEDFARRWTHTMAARDDLEHNPKLYAMWDPNSCRDASMLAENIGHSGTSADSIYKLYLKSPEHRRNILNPKLRYVGVGSWQRSDGSVFNTIDFANGSSPKYTKVKLLGQGL